MNKQFIRKAFVTGNYFTIAIKKRQCNIMQSEIFLAEKTLPASYNDWCADPFLVEEGDHTYLFYEKVRGGLGSIEVAEVLPDCTISDPTVLFEGTHYSYPYVFRKDSKWYMIPESSALSEVSLYCATAFPNKWEKLAVLIHEPAVDTTVFQKDNQWFLLTFIPVPGSERVTPYAYRMNGFNLELLNFSDYDPLCVRGAGSPFVYQNKLVRPVQVSTDIRYGDKIAFVEMIISGDSYSEMFLQELTPDAVKAQGQFYDGLHTYNASEHYEVIDIRCGQLSWNKPFKKAGKLLKR